MRHGVIGNDVATINVKRFFSFIFRVGELRGRKSDTVEPRCFEHAGVMKISSK